MSSKAEAGTVTRLYQPLELVEEWITCGQVADEWRASGSVGVGVGRAE